jgi:hypothetical protein
MAGTPIVGMAVDTHQSPALALHIALDRDQVLLEIRRTAAENGGIPLGRGRFERVTGLSEYTWTKYWPRWSEALKEAGFEPNQFNSRRADDDLLQRLADLVRELGHFPVTREIRVRVSRDPSFPNAKTLARLGNVRTLALKLKAFAEKRGYTDVALLCPEPSAEAAGREGRGQKQAPIAFVYLMRSARFYKIGRTNAVGRREREFAIQLPEDVRVVHSIKTDDPVGIEEYWHKRFADRRRKGEWFDLGKDDVAAFRRRSFM